MMLDFGAVSTKIWVTPRHHRSICQDCSKCSCSSLNPLYTPELLLDFRAIATKFSITPRHQWSICKDGGERCSRCLKPLHIPESILDFRWVTTKPWMTPSNDRSICQDGCKCTPSAWTRSTFLSWFWTSELFPPKSKWPQVTTDLSARIAANAPPPAWTSCTVPSWSWTLELSPPKSGSPHVTTDPSARIAANASSVAWTCCTLLRWCWTLELSPPKSDGPHVTMRLPPQHHNAKAFRVAATFAWSAIAVRSVSWSPASTAAVWRDSIEFIKQCPAVTNLKKPSLKDFCARIIKSSTLEVCEIESVSVRPLARATLTWNIAQNYSVLLGPSKASWAKLHQSLSMRGQRMFQGFRFRNLCTT